MAETPWKPTREEAQFIGEAMPARAEGIAQPSAPQSSGAHK